MHLSTLTCILKKSLKVFQHWMKISLPLYMESLRVWSHEYLGLVYVLSPFLNLILSQGHMIKANGSNRAMWNKIGKEKWIRCFQMTLPPLFRNVLCHALSWCRYALTLDKIDNIKIENFLHIGKSRTACNFGG
jgi:hypothetical protein